MAPDAVDGELIYIDQIHSMREFGLTTLYVDFGHILLSDEVLANAIQMHYYRFLPYLRRALYNLVAEFEPEYLKINPTAAAADSANLQSREFNIAFYHLPLVSGIRELRMDKIGRLVSISGTVTRTSEVRPELLYGSFICEVCNGLVHDVEQQFKYTEVRHNDLTDESRADLQLGVAISLPERALWQQNRLATSDRHVQVHRLAESSHSRKSF